MADQPVSSPILSAGKVLPPETLRVRVTSDPASLSPVRRAVEDYATAFGMSEAAVGEIGLVLNEAMANVIRHAYQNEPGKPIEVEAGPATADEQLAVGNRPALAIRLRDWGNGADPNKLSKRGYIPGEPGGLGLVCLKEMTDHVSFQPQPDGMLLTMVRRKC